MTVTNYEPDRFTSVGVSHRFQATPLDEEDGLGKGVLFSTNPFGTAVMPIADLRRLASWINEFGPLEGEGK